MNLVELPVFADPTPAFLAERFGLTPSESKTIALIAAGKPMKAVARERDLSIHTVASQVQIIFLKTGTNSQQALAVAAWRAWAAPRGPA